MEGPVPGGVTIVKNRGGKKSGGSRFYALRCWKCHKDVKGCHYHKATRRKKNKDNWTWLSLEVTNRRCDLCQNWVDRQRTEEDGPIKITVSTENFRWFCGCFPPTIGQAMVDPTNPVAELETKLGEGYTLESANKTTAAILQALQKVGISIKLLDGEGTPYEILYNRETLNQDQDPNSLESSSIEGGHPIVSELPTGGEVSFEDIMNPEPLTPLQFQEDIRILHESLQPQNKGKRKAEDEAEPPSSLRRNPAEGRSEIVGSETTLIPQELSDHDPDEKGAREMFDHIRENEILANGEIKNLLLSITRLGQRITSWQAMQTSGQLGPADKVVVAGITKILDSSETLVCSQIQSGTENNKLGNHLQRRGLRGIEGSLADLIFHSAGSSTLPTEKLDNRDLTAIVSTAHVQCNSGWIFGTLPSPLNPFAKAIFCWCIAKKEPITKSELAEAFALRDSVGFPSITAEGPEALGRWEEHVLTVTENLVEFDRHDRLEFIDRRVKDLVMSQKWYNISRGDAEEYLASLSLTYLSQGGFEQELQSDSEARRGISKYFVKHSIIHTLDAEEKGRSPKLAQEWLNFIEHHQDAFQRWRKEYTKITEEVISEGEMTQPLVFSARFGLVKLAEKLLQSGRHCGGSARKKAYSVAMEHKHSIVGLRIKYHPVVESGSGASRSTSQ